ncbi:MAG: cysteine/glutathione ABC transporter permease/ATP-binding protein CydD [Candidatus Endonucleobacter sp. (ex Gigantidas childressi)]|nr:cysteine/glutathione ABC transporter permease/ATP-binding protein CydD [Candidatus Endonucleobacter sp. (ex Gigantidas childressi)]
MSNNRKKQSGNQAYRWLMGQAGSVRKWLVASIVMGLLSCVLLLIQVNLMADIIHKLVMELVPREQLLTSFILSLIVVFARACCAWGREVCGFCAGARVRANIRAMLFDKLQRLGPLVISQQACGGWTTIVVEQVEELQDFIARYLPQMVLVVFTPVVIIIAVLPMNWAVAGIFMITAPLIPVFMALVGMKAAEANRRNFKALERLGGFFLDRLQGMETLRVFRRSAQTQQELVGASEDFRSKTMDVLRLAFLSSAVLEFFASVSIALTAVYLGMSFLGYINFGDYGDGVSLYVALFLLLIAPDFYQPFRELGTYYHAKAKAVAATDSILAVMNKKEHEEHKGVSLFNNRGAIDIQANSLTVALTATQSPLLNDLSFVIRGGSRVAIVGPSGAGKTTLINTLMGFYPYQGYLSVSGQLLSDIKLSEWRSHLAWLGQLPLIVAGTVMDNIAFGREISREQAVDALTRAQGLDVLDGLPSSGLDSLLREQGGNISVGQAQRIALARAIAVPVNLLFLDEPTANLDLESEQRVLAAIQQLPKTTTVITVTHRIKQIMGMDQVLLIEGGRLVVEGDPKELVKIDGPFKAFIEGQSRSFDNA